VADRVVHLVADFRQDSGPPEQVHFAPGATIFEQGDRGQLVYLVEQGEVDIVRVRADGGEEPVAAVTAGYYFGELGPLLGFPARRPRGPGPRSWPPR